MACALLLRACGLAACLATTPAVAKCQLQTLELPVRMVGSRAVATVGINGTPVPLMVDSGAFYSFLMDGTAEQLKLPTKRADGLRVEGITGRVVTRATKVEKLELLGGEIPNVEFLVGGNDAGADTMGIMGRNMLAFTDVEYDLAHGAIRLHFPNDDCRRTDMAYWAGSSPVTEVALESGLRDRTPAIRAKVKLNGAELTALFDTGATTLVALSAARRAGVAASDMTPAGRVFGGGRGSAEAWTARFDRFEVGGEVISNNTLRVADFGSTDGEMLLGIDFFLSHRIYVAKAQAKIYITYAGGKVFSLNRNDGTAKGVGDAGATADGGDAASADQLARRGAASASRQDYASALADLDRACALEPASAAYLAQRGTIHQALRQPAKALQDFDRALTIDPAQDDARSRRVVLRLAAKDRDGAKADLDVLDRTLAPQAQMRLAMSFLYRQLDDPAMALAQLDRWLPSHPNEVQRHVALDSRCLVRLRLGTDLDKALDDCDDAVGAASNNPAYLDHRGWVYLRLGRHRNARSDFDRSLELQPTNAWALYGRGLTKTRQGDAADGDADLAAARKLVPDIEAQVAKSGRVPGPAAKS